MSLRIDVWSDIACPWCFVGKRRLEQALAGFAQRDQVELVWRAFELDPTAPKTLSSDVAYTARLAKKYRTSVQEGEAMCQRMTEVAAKDGLAFRFDRIRPGNTFDAHRVLHLALEHNCQDAMKERLFAAYLEEGEAIGEHDVLTRLAVEVGLDEAKVAQLLAADTFAEDVRQDEAMAGSLGIRGVPFFVLDRRLAVSGAQPAEVLGKALEEAWAQHAASDEAEPGASSAAADEDAAACGPDGCRV